MADDPQPSPKRQPKTRRPRPMRPAAVQECAAFVRHLRQTGNARIAAEAVGVNATTLWCRRRDHPDFAAEWDAALVFARAALADKRSAPAGEGLRTAGGEYQIRTNKHGHLQVSRAARGRLTRAGERAFLKALASTANIRLAAQSIGFAVSALYERRYRSNAFDEEVRAALAIGYETVEFALLACARQSLGAPEDVLDGGAETWEGGTGVNPLIRTTPFEAMILLGLHRRTVKESAHGCHRTLPTATREETNAAVMKELERLERRRRRDAGEAEGGGL
ncbi:hypothetical protein [Sphingomonas sp.]|uniref:hypothetical protein n=1 Tax=Sphingomonas sp. TaxID=28214 RepID=UPI002ED87197